MTPCTDPRDNLHDDALRDHHVALERLVEKLLKDPAVPETHREELRQEQARYKADQHSIQTAGTRNR